MPTSDLLNGLETKHYDVYSVSSQYDDITFQLLFVTMLKSCKIILYLNFLPQNLSTVSLTLHFAIVNGINQHLVFEISPFF